MPAAQLRRRAALLGALDALGADAALVTDVVNVRYLTGFTGSNGALLLSRGGAVLATDGRYRTQAAAQAPDVELLVERAVAPALAAAAVERGLRRVGFEAHHVTVAAYDALVAAAPGLELLRLGAAVEAERAVKDAAEVELLREACAVGDRALADLLPTVRAGQTEREVAVRLERLLADHGGDGLAFASIVAAGPNAAVPHHRPTDRPLERGDLLTLDFGARRGGYHADMTRTVVLGPPAEWQRDLHALVRESQAAGVAALRAGASRGEVDGAARRVLAAAGHELVHGLGHGVGLAIHEAPLLSTEPAATLPARCVVTVEPGVYLPGRGGVRIEDVAVVGAGPAECLTTSGRDLIEV